MLKMKLSRTSLDQNGQQSTAKQNGQQKTTGHSLEAQCTWPAPLAGTTWTDMEKGELVFGETTMTGWSFEVDGQVRNEWKCVKSDTFEENGYLLMVTTESFIQFVTTHYYAYLCLRTKKVTDVSYRYYIEEPIQTNLNYERLLVFPLNTLNTVEKVCYPSYGASGSEYKLLVKTGSETSAAIQCPYNFLGVYDYTHTSADGTQTCSGGNSLWDVCSDNTVMTFNLGQCPTKIAYSDSPTVLCIDTVPIDGSNYVTVYNSQDATVDDATTYRFSCFAASADGSAASVAPKYCRKGQTPDSVPVSNEGIPVGATMTIPTVYTTCPTCPVPVSPDGGSVYVQTDGAVTTAHYQCAEDYSLYGAEIRTCLSDNTWEFDMPACKCNEPTPPTNGAVTVSSDGVIATYNCLAGYTLNGNSERYCQDDGKAWNGTEPTCDICDTLADPTAGTVTVSIDGPTSKATYRCNAGYTLVGVRERLCLNGGSWDLTEPTCVQCVVLNAPDLGSVTITTDGSTSTATFNCSAGYQLTDSTQLSCAADGMWDLTEPVCVCESLTPPTNGDVTMSDDGQTATYTCSAGFTINGSTVRVCLMDGTAWNGTAPTCVKCPDLPELANGTVTLDMASSQTKATFTCSRGYTLSGSTVSVCLFDGTWDNPVPTCVLCDSVADPNGGSVTMATNGTTSIATYQCANDYYLDGVNSSLCLSDGSWDTAAPECYCVLPGVPQNGGFTLSNDKLTLTYQCDTGYTISGSSLRVCSSDGTGWTGTQPTCESCQTLPNLSGGSVELISTGTITQGNFSCDVGYTMNGVSLLSCRSDGSWDLSPPTCVLCDVPGTPVGGSYSQETDGKVTVTKYSCPIGYGLSGSATTNCRSDGSWDSSSPVCVECPTLQSPSSGSVALSSIDGITTVATLTCVSGYHIQGISELYCGQSGTWDNNSPSCVCDTPPTILFGSVTSNGSVAVYSCEIGYTADGSSARNCGDDGTGWEGVGPTCVTCSALTGPQNGHINLTTDGSVTVALFSCDVGYTVNGSQTSRCQPDGSWDTVSPVCVVCNQLIEPVSGSFSLETNGTVTQAEFTCIMGYEVFGSLLLTCDSEGSWDAVEPDCVCIPPSAPLNGSLSLSEDRLTALYNCDAGFTLDGTGTRECQPNGLLWSDIAPSCVKCTVDVTSPGIDSTFSTNGTTSSVQFSCMENYTMVGSSTAECHTNGQLDKQPPSCVSCETLSQPNSGSLVISTNGTTSTATYTCSDGYYMVGEVTRTCGQDGQWDGTDVLCICEPPLFLANGNVSLSIDGLTATYECDTGYILAGTSVRTCAVDGTGWTGSEPSCTTCESITTPTGGSIDLMSDGSKTIANFTCEAGTSLLGESVLTCQEDGTWDGTEPTCVSCPTLSDPDSGQLQVSTDGSVSMAVFSCSPGYNLSGTASLTCLTTGIWSDDTPTCVCNPPSSLDNGQVTLLDDGYRVQYTCNLGYSMDGVRERQCATDGSGWSDSQPVCVSCPNLASPANGSVTTSTDGTTTTATFECQTGTSMNGSPYLACLTDGTWNDSVPICVTCPSLNTPSSGSVNITSTGSTTLATYSCMQGYRLLGSSERECSDTGVWESADPQCVCIPPLTPTNGQITVSADSMTISYACKSGYTLEGVSARNCQTDGSGWDEADPVCNKCGALDNISGGSITMTTDGVETQAIYSCDTGYSMNGGSVLTCRSDGTWDIAPPTCTSCEAQTVPASGDVTMTTDGQTTTATFSCLPGYTIQGQSNITCRGDGFWNFVTPSCVHCESLTSPNSGSYALSTNGSVTMATFSCVSNYHIVGSSRLYCDTTGNWDDTEPLCACDTPPAPSRGSVNSDGITVTYTCETGYTLNGTSRQWCGNDGSWWNGMMPTCNKCDTLENLMNGDISIQTDGVKTLSAFTCAAGYTISGPDTATCRDNGTWDVISPSCIECQSLFAPVSGNVSLQTSGTVTVADFSCIPGYNVFGSSVLICDENGVWDATEPTCVCQEPVTPQNGSVTFAEDRMSVTFSCDVGFSLSGTGVQTCQYEGPGWTDTSPTCVECVPLTPAAGLKFEMSTDGTMTELLFSCDTGYTMIGTQQSFCMSDGTWDSPEPTCVSCPNLITPDSGLRNISTNGTVSTVKYICADGYSLVGDPVRFCQDNGLWTGQDVTCICLVPAVPTNGNFTIAENGMTVTYVCEVGYNLIGDSTRQCGNDGSGWSGSDPQCVFCETLITPSGGSMNLSSDGVLTLATFTCHVGSTIVGAALLTCQSDGSWDLPEPTCVSCPLFSDPDSGYVTINSDGQVTTAEFACSSGYSIVGATTLSCQTSGLWSDASPVCVCEPPVTPDNGQISLSDDGFTITYTCDSGYTLRGNSQRYCGSNSTGWSGSDPSCVSCPALVTPTNGYVSQTTDGLTTKATFSCDVGFSLSGTSELICLGSGIWNDVSPDCVPCGALQDIDSGSISTNTDGINTVATYTCASGYYLDGEAERVCLNTGNWTSTDPRCVCEVPVWPTDGSISSSDDGMTVEYVCSVGFTLRGVTTRHCQNNGAGWDQSSPSCTACESLQNLSGGTITQTTDGTVTYAIFNCDIGYTMTGTSVLSCRSDGSWNMSQPTCTSCQPQQVPTDGNIHLTSDGITTTAIFSCLIGYSLQGAAEVRCRSDGTWEYVVPSCVQCPTLTSPASGNYTISTDGTTSTAIFSCSTGYYLEGTATLSCDSSGTWTDVEPLCKCNPLPAPANGSVVLSIDGMQSTYSCSTGFTLVGVPTRVCGSDGTSWDGSDPSCVKCADIGTIDNGELILSSDGITTVAVFSCSVGSTVSGSSTADCGSDGSWNVVAPQCAVCPNLTVPSNSSLDLQTDGAVTMATFTCDSEFSLSGDSVLYCGSDGFWNTVEPVCVECLALQSVSSGTSTITTNGTVTSAMFTCDTGYYLEGPPELHCLPDGTWSDTLPSCVCNQPSPPHNGSVWISADGMTALYNCNLGFTLDGQDTSRCGENGSGWSSEPPSCVECQALGSADNGNYEIKSDSTVTKATVTCDKGYTLNGSTEITCQTSGFWDISIRPTCVKCQDLVPISSGTFTVTTDGVTSTTTYTCLSGYYLLGSSTRQCAEDGVWSGSEPLCVCTTPPSPQNGNITISDDYTTATANCGTGYTLAGDRQRTCQQDGSGWNGVVPTCSICSTVSSPAGGSVTMDSDGTTTVAKYACNLGYSMEGWDVLQCRSDGSWDVTAPTCTLCQSLSPPSDSRIQYRTDGVSTAAAVACETGYTLKGTNSLTCLSDGRWNDSLPSCVACPSITPPDSGSVDILTDGLTSKAVFSCSDGYNLQGQITLTCFEDGLWNDTDPVCTCIRPPALGNGTVILSADKSVVTYSCDTGFSLDGNNVRVCQKDGSGWNGSEPTCAKCETVGAPDNGTLLIQTSGVESVAVFGCELGFSLSGQPVVTCQADGVWDSTYPVCVKCDPVTDPENGNVAIVTDGTQSAAVYSCDVGYSILTSHLQPTACLYNGSWESETPVCSKCADLLEVVNGGVTMSSNGSWTIAMFDCLTGYYLSGEVELTCQGDGTWDNSEPTCLCDPPPLPVNGNISSDGMTVTYTCSKGYSMNGTQTRDCSLVGNGWNAEPPTCVKCQDLPQTSEAYTTDTDGVSMVTSFTCPQGKTLKGNASLTCGSDGFWDSTIPSCVDCEPLYNITSGTLEFKTDGTVTSVTYSCIDSYYLIGPSERTCLDSGVWDRTEPRCVCNPPDTPLHANITVSDDKGSVVFSCEPGYSLDGQNSLICSEDGSGWNGDIPLCTTCETLSTPVGASVEVTFQDTVSVAQYTCASGFTMSGPSVLSCRSDGTWNLSAPVCVSCPSVDSPVHGDVDLLTGGLVTTAHFTCGLGYSLNGSVETRCRSDGIWDSSAPNCVECPNLESPSSGIVVLWSDGAQTLANISCSSGYYLDGAAQVVCDGDGKWNYDIPKCYCEDPVPPDHGSFELSADKLTAQFECLTGYTLQGNQVLTCLSNDSGWNSAPPICVTCEPLQSVDNGSSVLSSDGITTVSTFSCELGSSLNGSNKTECGTDGKWNLPTPSCVTCPALPDFQNGTVTLLTDGISTSAFYSCDIGFTIKGLATIMCHSTGVWEEQPPICVPCQNLVAPSSGVFEVTTDGSVTMATFSCSAGYSLMGHSELSCRNDGTWDHSFPTCVCTSPYEIDSGNYTISSDGMSVVYTCHTGYSLVGEATRYCADDGSGWQGTTPFCVACQSVPTINIGSFTQQTNGTVSSLIYSCPVGYSLDGSQELLCREDGSWNIGAPTCITCAKLTDVSSGSYTTSSDGATTTVQYSCSPGYDLIGSPTSQCQATGSWDLPPPLCYCETPDAPLNGQVSSNGTEAVYTCSSGYSLRGVGRRICNQDGSGWSDDPPTCETCETLPVPTGGSVTFTSDGQYTSVTIDCDVGYTLDGTKSLLCSSDGTWNTQPPTCGVPCNTLSTPDNSTVTLVSDGTTTRAVFDCDIGSSLKGESIIACRADGTWDFSEPTCATCPQLSSPTSGTLSVTTDGVTTMAEFSCADGYHLVGEPVLECLDSGVWNTSAPHCDCDLPSIPGNGGFQATDDNAVISFYCDTGFSLKGSSQVTCLLDGTGYNDTIPECVQCEEFPTLFGGSQKINSDSVTSVMSLSCDTGYSLKGQIEAVCSDNGSWEISSTPECVLCPPVTSVQNGLVIISTNGIVSMTTFQCGQGYSIKGTTTTACQTDGTWDSQVPTCVSCPELSTPDSGHVQTSTNGTVTTALFTCMFGYYLSGQSTLQCLENGKWDAEAPICVCSLPYQPSNGEISVSENGFRVSYACDLGYSLLGISSRQCQANGAGWDGQDPSCVTCPSGVSITSGDFMTSTNGLTTTVRYNCSGGFTLKGDQALECSPDGSWSGDAPECVQCQELEPPDSSVINQSTDGRNTVVRYTCGDGYYLKGTSERICQEDGSWTDVDPVCECQTPASPVNGDITSNGQTAVYSCSEGFTLQGDSTRYCGSGGTGWNSTEPTCVSCDMLDSTSNSMSSFSTDGLVTSVTFSCGAGYTLFGTVISFCRSDGTWSSAAATCVACETLSPLDNGSINITTDGVTTQTQYSCESGYSLKGFSVLTCRSDGLWDFSPPVCVPCSSVFVPHSSSVTLSTDGISSFATYSCAPDYYMSGPDTVKCLSSGQWESNSTQCICIPPMKPDNGSHVITNGGSHISYTCEAGFSLDGPVERQCLENGLGWDGVDPQCLACDALNDISGGSLTLVTNGTQTSLVITCELGSSVNGSVSVGCGKDGSWEYTIPTCVSCPTLSSSLNGEFYVWTNGTTTTAVYTCHLNYTLSGEQNIVCGSDALWETESPTCVECITDTLIIDSGSYHLSTNGSVTKAEFSCVENYYIHGNSELYCMTDGTWTSVPTCVCNHPGAIENGAVEISADKMEAKYTCDIGYSLVGIETRQCQHDGLGWTMEPPECMTCDSIPIPENGSARQHTNGAVTMATFSCDIGFSLNGQPTLSCLQDGSWELQFPTCVSCLKLSDPDSGYISYATDGQQTTASYQCAEGYFLEGIPDRVCDENGNWGASTPSCKCISPADPLHGSVSVSVNGSVASYSCDVGYTISGVTERQCQTDGKGWSETQPECVLCDTLSTPSGGHVELNSDGHMTMAEFTCSSGYTMDGPSIIGCREDGTWNSTEPSCRTCEAVNKPDHGEIIFNTDGKVTTVSVECGVGYTLSGSSELECRADGTWNFNLPSCVMCPGLTSPENGNVSLISDTTQTTALFACVSGYHIFGQSILTCDETGSWNTMEPSCVCDTPASPENGGINLSADQMTLMYSCENGFSLKGSVVRYCAMDGSGWDSVVPVCVECQDLADPDGSVSTLTTDGVVSYKTFTCGAGASLNGSAVVACGEDGSWSENAPNCAGCPGLSPPKAGSMSITTDGLTSVATFTCYIGYRIVGDNSLTCQSSGVWNSQTPTCACDVPPAPDNGIIRLSDNQMSVTYLCDDSFTLTGNQSRSCDETGGGWDGTDSTCVQCEELDLMIGMSNKYTSDGVHSIAEFTCNSGYTLKGSDNLVCDENGEWIFDIFPECVSCSEPDAPVAGTVVMATNGKTTKAYFTCLTGYHVYGNSEIECNEDGLWSSAEPVCHCDTPANISQGYVVSDGKTASYYCLPGYTLNGEGTRHCLSDGAGWDGVKQTCISCLTIEPLINGSIVISTNGTVTKSSFRCEVGFTLKGSDVISCQNDGLWEESLPVCVSCPELDEISSGAVSLQTSGQTTVAVFTCVDGYEIFGTPLLTCLEDGQWDSTAPSCVCKVPDLPNSAVVLSEDRLTIQHTCDVGFSLKGSSERMCLQDGSGWELVEPECVGCEDLAFDTGNITMVTDGLESVAVFSCEPGQSLKGTYSLTCNTSGSWIGETPECVSCPTLTPPSSGSVEVSSTGAVSMATYSCLTGYTLVGGSQRVCGINGNWTSAQPSCVCEKPPAIASGNYQLTANNTVADYSCDVGYSLQGSTRRVCLDEGWGWDTEEPTCVKCPVFQTFSNGNISMSMVDGQTEALFECSTGCSLSGQSKLMCLSDGSWDFQVPSCVCCPSLSAMSSGHVNISSDGITTTALFTCASNYSLIGEDLLTCRSDGFWDFDQPRCSCVTPSDPLNGQVTMETDNCGDSSVAIYRCGFGYSLSGLSERKCLPDGTGWEGEEPTCLLCSSIPQPDNGTAEITSDGLKTIAMVTCIQGYSLTGESRLTCEADGNWTQTAPDCVKCPTLSGSLGLRYNTSTDRVVTTATFECAAGFELVGQTSLTCLRNGSWDAEQPTCLEITVTTTPVVCEQTECSSGATTAIAVVLSLIIVGLIIALAVLFRLYRKLYKRSAGGKSLMYTTEGKTSGEPFTSRPGVDSDHTKLSLSTFDDIEIFSKATAPLSHRRHVLDMGRTQSSLAPSGHQKHLLELAGQSSSPAPVSYLTPSRTSTLAQFTVQNKRVSQLLGRSSATPSPKPYEASLLTPTPRAGSRGRSNTPSPVPSTADQDYDTNLPQQILTPREVPMVDVSPKPTPTADKKVLGQNRQKQGVSLPKAPKRKKQSKTLQESESFTSRPSQSSQFRDGIPHSVKLAGVQNKDAEA